MLLKEDPRRTAHEVQDIGRYSSAVSENAFIFLPYIAVLAGVGIGTGIAIDSLDQTQHSHEVAELITTISVDTLYTVGGLYIVGFTVLNICFPLFKHMARDWGKTYKH